MQQVEFGLEIFIDPLSDFGFKKIFVQQENPTVLRDFLNSILALENPIVEIALITAEQLGDGKTTGKQFLMCIAKMRWVIILS